MTDQAAQQAYIGNMEAGFVSPSITAVLRLTAAAKSSIFDHDDLSPIVAK